MFKNNKIIKKLVSIFSSLDYKIRTLLMKLTCLALLPLIVFLYINVMRGNFIYVLNCSLGIYLSVYLNKSVQGRG